MKKFSVLLSETAVRQLQEIEARAVATIKAHLRELESDPFKRRSGADIKRLHGPEEPHLWRLRVGDWRAIYFTVGSEVKVTEIMHRSKGYAWLE